MMARKLESSRQRRGFGAGNSANGTALNLDMDRLQTIFTTVRATWRSRRMQHVSRTGQAPQV